jgi:hypothetical protein
MSAVPRLLVYLDGRSCAEVAPPVPFPPRAWLLGVVAVQATVEANRPAARLRVHLTGAPQPAVVPLGESALVQVALCEELVPPLPAIAPAELDEAVAQLVLLRGNERLATARLLQGALSMEPAPRAFSHVFCRWLREGGIEPGCDLTDFLSLPEGTKYERLVSAPLEIGEVISIAWSSSG